ncbi:protein kinase, partial [Nonomuraea sp. NPDC049784]|uniref:serine/threonine-protein kinase n=1 Tax=Nonomuraea sp. NPDC049784 TaxID=3154361 RepID=UPI0033DB5A85
RGPRVIDFGIARDVDTLAAHTQAGQVMGSPGWVAPERLTGGPAVPASDVFAWGCLVAFAAAGHHPFGGGEADVLTRRILFDPPRVAGVPAMLQPAVEAALAKDPADRPRSADLLRVLLAAGGVGEPWDLRQAVAGVLEEIWTPVPYPPGGGRVRLAGPPGDTGSDPSGVPEDGVERSGTRRRRRNAGAHLSHASFAALATVSIAAITVIAAAGGDGMSIGGGSLLPGNPPVVQPHGSAESTVRPSATPTGALPPTRALVTAPVTTTPTPTQSVSHTRTKSPSTLLDPSPERKNTFQPPNTSGPGDPGGDDPGECANPASRRRGNAARRSCPQPSGSISTIPQDGPGESPDPSVSVSETPTATGS